MGEKHSEHYSVNMTRLLRGLIIMANTLFFLQLNSSHPVNTDIRRISHSSSLEKPSDLHIRVRRRAQDTGFSVIEQFEVLRKRYLESLRARAPRPTRAGASSLREMRDERLMRVEENQNF